MYFKYAFVCLWMLAAVDPSHQLYAEEVDDVFDLTTRVLEVIAKSWVIVEKVEERAGDDKSPTVWYMKKKERMLLNNLGRISNFVHKTQRETDDIRFMTLGNLKKLQSLPNAVINGIQINELIESVRSLENDFATMTDYGLIEKNTTLVNQLYSSYTLEKFADAMLSYSSGSPHKQMSKIHSFIVPEWDGFKFHTHGGIFNILLHTLDGSDMLCDQKQSLQQLIFNLYKTLLLTQLKGYSVIQLSWMVLQIKNTERNFTYEKNQYKEKFDQKIKDQLEALQEAMKSASNRYWRCDPDKHISGKTYAEVTQLLQGYIENEADMNYEQSCMNNCGYYEVAEHKSCFKDQFCAKQRTCNGRILNCQFIDSDMKLCQSKFGTNRRYDYIAYKNGKVLGDSSAGCKGTMSKVDSWWVYLLWHCSYCFCICDSSDSASDRYFSLKESLSNVTENKVVTGIRVKKVNQMFHLQIEEGELGPRGSINETSRHWVDVPGREFNYRNSSLKNGENYHTLTFTERAVDLDEVIASKNEVVTGVRLRMIGSHLNLQIQVTPFNFTTGKLRDTNLTHWLGNDKTELSVGEERTEIDINDSDLPTKMGIPSEPDMSSNKFLKFTHSSIDRDVAQTTLPFIDIQEVAPFPAVPLSGVGIYFKGVKDHAGFIGAKVFTYNLSDDINLSLFQDIEKYKELVSNKL